MLGAAGNVT